MVFVMNPRVKKVTPQPGYKFKIVFSNNEQGLYDCSKLLDFGVFQELKDMAYFNKIRMCNGTIAWPNEQDICPNTILH